MDFIQTHGFDGLDVDWEYPGDTERGGNYNDRDNYSLLLEELKAAFQPFGWLLSAAVPAPKSRIDSGYDVKRISQVLDFINVMTYDLHGSWDGFADHHSPLFKRQHDYYPFNTLTVDYSMQYWHQKGAPKDKLIMGVPFYGRSFVLQSPDNFKPGQSAKSKGNVSHFIFISRASWVDFCAFYIHFRFCSDATKRPKLFEFSRAFINSDICKF